MAKKHKWWHRIFTILIQEETIHVEGNWVGAERRWLRTTKLYKCLFCGEFEVTIKAGESE